MPNPVRSLTVAILATAAISASPARAQQAPGVSTWPGDVTPAWRESPSGAAFAGLYGDPAEEGPFAFLMRMPSGWTMRPHTHDTGEYLTVLSGTLYMTFEPGGEWTALPPGSVIAIDAGVPMWAKAGEAETVLQVSGVGPFHTEPVTEAPGEEE